MQEKARWPVCHPLADPSGSSTWLWMARGKIEVKSGFWSPTPRLPGAAPELLPEAWVLSPCPFPAQPLATGLCGLGPERRPSPVPIPLPGASSWGGTRLPPWGLRQARLLAAGRLLPEHAPPIYRQGPPPTAISVSCQLPAAHSGRRSREPAQSCHPRLGGNTESLPAELPFLSPSAQLYLQLLGARDRLGVRCPFRGQLVL